MAMIAHTQQAKNGVLLSVRFPLSFLSRFNGVPGFLIGWLLDGLRLFAQLTRSQGKAIAATHHHIANTPGTH